MGVMGYISLDNRLRRSWMKAMREGRIAGAGQSFVDVRVKELFFDRPAVERAMDEPAKVMMEIGAKHIRRRAQTSMRYTSGRPGKYTPSKPGQPPRAVREHPLVRRHLYYHYDPSSRSAVIGPARLAIDTGAPHTLEFGGSALIRNSRRVVRRVGDGAELRIGGPIGPTAKPAVDQHGQTVMVTYGLIRTAGQAARANRLNRQLYGTAKHKRVTVEPRPFMGPALVAEVPNLPTLWRSSLRGA
jgi:hypothetical protein